MLAHLDHYKLVRGTNRNLISGVDVVAVVALQHAGVAVVGGVLIVVVGVQVLQQYDTLVIARDQPPRVLTERGVVHAAERETLYVGHGAVVRVLRGRHAAPVQPYTRYDV